MRFTFSDFRQFFSGFKKKLMPRLGVFFAGFMMLMIAIAGLGPLVRQWAPDDKKIDEKAKQDASQFIKVIADPNAKPGEISLEQPHRDNEQVGEWLVQYVAELMNVAPDAYDNHVRDIARFANEHARSAYHGFMINSNMLETMKSNRLKLVASVEGLPFMLNSGTVDGSYHWLFEIPVLLTYLPVDAKSYTESSHSSQHILVTVQAGRVPFKVNADELVIENFSVRANPEYADKKRK